MNILTTEDARFIDREVPKQLGISLEILIDVYKRQMYDKRFPSYCTGRYIS